jgi:hypothetical protein
MKTTETFLISQSVLPRMKNVSDNICRGNQNIHFVFYNSVFENRRVYEIMWKNIVQRGRPHMTIGRVRIACWITKATHTRCHTAFPLQQWLQERDSLLSYTYSACLARYDSTLRKSAGNPWFESVPEQLLGP